jgi:NAD(P)-dependent dehydrogenase (short-subunit alcohol dehydrogenase family)
LHDGNRIKAVVPTADAISSRHRKFFLRRELAQQEQGTVAWFAFRENATTFGVFDAFEETHDTLAALHPVGRMGDIGDIVEAIMYLETAEFVTGEILHVDGGQSAGH